MQGIIYSFFSSPFRDDLEGLPFADRHLIGLEREVGPDCHSLPHAVFFLGAITFSLLLLAIVMVGTTDVKEGFLCQACMTNDAYISSQRVSQHH